MPIICLMVRENHKMVREMSGKSQGILWGLMAGHPDLLAKHYFHFVQNSTIFFQLIYNLQLNAEDIFKSDPDGILGWFHLTHTACSPLIHHEDIIKWKHFPCNRTFMWGIHRLLVNTPHKSQWPGALMFSLLCTWINGWVNNYELVIWDTITLIMTSP